MGQSLERSERRSYQFKWSGTSRRRVKCTTVGDRPEGEPNDRVQPGRRAQAHTRHVANTASQRDPQTKPSCVAQAIWRGFADDRAPGIGEIIGSC